jgi:protein TonB
VESWQEPEVVENKGGSKGILIAAIIVAVAILGGAGTVGYLKYGPKKFGSSPSAVTQSASTTALSLPKPTAATPADTTASATLPASTATTPTTASPATAATSTDQKPRVQSAMMDKQLNAPSRIPNDLRLLAGKEAPPSTGFGASGMDAGLGGAVFSGSGSKVKVEGSKKPQMISAGVAVGLLLQKTAPVYPPIARTARVSGAVVIQATISKTGTVVNPRVVNGPTMLRQAALDAVKSWRYRPYQLNGEPVEVETTVNVVFTLGE